MNLSARLSWFFSEEGILFLFALALGIFLRTYNVGHSLGAHPDERHIIMTTMSLVENGMNPKSFAYGSFPFYLLWIVSRGAGGFYSFLQSYDGLFYSGRIFLGTCGFLLTAGLLLSISRKVFSSILPGFFGIILLSGNTFHLQLSRFFTVDPVLLLTALFTFWALLRAYDQASWGRYALVGVGFGLSLATKSSGLSLLCPLGLLLLFRHPFWHGERSLKQFIGGGLVFVVVGLVTVFCAAPFQFLDFERFLKDQREQISMVAGLWRPPYTIQYMHTPPFLYHLKQMFFFTIGPVASWLVIGGVAFSLFEIFKRKNWRLFLLLAWCLAFFLATGGQMVKFPRYLLPLYPILFLMAGGLLTFLYERVRPSGRVLYLLFVCVIGLTPGLFYLAVYKAPHGYEQASRWIFANIKPGSLLLEPHWDDRLPISLPGLSGDQYPGKELPIYERDTDEKLTQMVALMAEADYLVFPTQRIPGSLSLIPEEYRQTNQLLSALWEGALGYTMVYVGKQYPELLGFKMNDDTADESLSVYDHPKVWIFKNEKKFSADELNRLVIKQQRLLSREEILEWG